MTAINFTSDGTAKIANVLTRNTDSTVLTVAGEHSFNQPYLVEYKRKLPDLTSSGAVSTSAVRRGYLVLRKFATANSGLENEATVPVVLRVEASIPMGVDSATVDSMYHDLLALSADASFETVLSTGVIPE